MPKPSRSQAPQRPAPGRPKDLAKRASILEAAKCMFLERGFEGVSMDQIAARAGVSKLTVYSHFGDKEALFVEAIAHYCDEQVPATLFTPAPEQPLRPRLLGIARAVHALIASPEAISGIRVMCTPASVASQLPEMFWNAGAGHLQAEFAALLERRTAAGEIAVGDCERAAGQFFALLKGDLHLRLLLGCGAPPGYDAEAHITATVDMFLRAYAPPATP